MIGSWKKVNRTQLTRIVKIGLHFVWLCSNSARPHSSGSNSDTFRYENAHTHAQVIANIDCLLLVYIE